MQAPGRRKGTLVALCGGAVTITYQRDGKQVVERWYFDPARWVPLDAAERF